MVGGWVETQRKVAADARCSPVPMRSVPLARGWSPRDGIGLGVHGVEWFDLEPHRDPSPRTGLQIEAVSTSPST